MNKPEGKLLIGKCEEVLASYPDNFFTCVVTDPPYGLSNSPDMAEVLACWDAGKPYVHNSKGFMGREWDSFVPGPNVWKEIMRTLQPSGHVLSFSGSRTYDLMVKAMEIAGNDFDCHLSGYRSWTYGSGFPKSMNIGKGVAKKTECEEEAKLWEGYGTALKPAHEPVAVFTKGKGEPLSTDSLFYYIPKANKKERNAGCDELYWLTENGGHKALSKEEYDAHVEAGDTVAVGNIWPTVKPVELMRQLIRLVKREGQNVILDPFMGSGTTLVAAILEGCDYVGIDADGTAIRISEARVRNAIENPVVDKPVKVKKAKKSKKPTKAQVVGVKKFIEKGLDVEIVASMTGLTVDQVENLK